MSVGVGLCRNVGRSDVFVFEFSVLALSLNTHSFFMNSQAHSFFMNSQAHSLFTKPHSHPLHKTTLTSSNKHNRVQIWAWEEQ